MQYGGKVCDEYGILYHKFQIPVHIKLLLKILFLSSLFLYLLAALAFQGKTLCGHCCLPDSMYGTVILMSFFQTICTHNHSMNGCLIIFPL